MQGVEHTDDFASAAMMRLIAAGLARQGIAAAVHFPAGAHVPRTAKRDILSRIMQEHGALAVLRIADAASHMPPEPVVQALLRADTIDDMLRRWHRLERFSHGRHVVITQRADDGSYALHHVARDAGPTPCAAETLLVMAVLTTLAEQVTGGPVGLCGTDGSVMRRDRVWVFDRSISTAGMFIMSGRRIDRWVKPPCTVARESLADDLRSHIATDPLRRWTLVDLATAAGLPTRTLQRRLAAQSTSFSKLVAAARLQTAANYLCDESGPGLAAVGFLAGYSDQSHFTRAFTAAVGTTPASYRSDFAS